MAAVLELKARLDNLLATAQEETKDIDLFAPIAEREECQICMIPIPLDDKEITFMACCGKSICTGCIHRNWMNGAKNGKPRQEVQKCSFCRQPPPENIIKSLKVLMKRDNSSQAFMQMAIRYKRGEGVIQSDSKALEMYIRAAELGFAEAFGKLGSYYQLGVAPVELDMSKALAFYEICAKQGSVRMHRMLSEIHGRNGNHQESIKHLKVAASAGEQDAMALSMKFYKVGLLSKEDLTKTLRAHQTSLNEMKSTERDDARAFLQLHSGDLERLRKARTA